MDSQAVQTTIPPGIEQAAGQGPEGGVPRADAPSDSDVARFQDSLVAPTEHGTGAGEQAVASGKVQEMTASPPPSLGDSILQGMDKMRGSREAHMNAIGELVGKESLSPQDMMRLQFELAQLNMQQDLTVKVADKANQGVQTLFKNQ